MTVTASFVNVSAATSTADGHSIGPLNMPASMVAGNYVVGFVSADFEVNETFSWPAGWNVIVASANAFQSFSIAWALVTSSSMAGPTVTCGTNTGLHAYVAQYKNVSGIGAFNSNAATVTTGNTLSGGDLTTTQANSLVVFAQFAQEGANVTLQNPSGYNEEFDESPAAFTDLYVSDCVPGAEGASSPSVSYEFITVGHETWATASFELYGPPSGVVTTTLKSPTQTNDVQEVEPVAITTKLMAITQTFDVTEIEPTHIAMSLKAITQIFDATEVEPIRIAMSLRAITQSCAVNEFAPTRSAPLPTPPPSIGFSEPQRYRVGVV